MNRLVSKRYLSVWLINMCLTFQGLPIHDTLAMNLNDKFSSEWQNEINISLHRNIHGHCNWTVSKTTNMEGISVSLHLPSHKEISQYNQRPRSMNKGNSKLLTILQSPKLVEWANEKTVRWMIPLDHPGQDRQMCINNTRTLGLGMIVNDFYTTRYPYIERVSYLLRSKNALIRPSGVVMWSCGEYQGIEACETRWDHSLNKVRTCRDYLNNQKQYRHSSSQSNNKSSNQLSSSSSSSSWLQFLQHIIDPTQKELIRHCSINQTAATFYKKVFVITAQHDFNFHHLITDSLARLPRYLSFLHKHPDIMIHIRDWQTPYPRQDFEIFGSIKSREMLFNLLGIDMSRVISGIIVAEKVYVPRALSCSDALRNPAEIRLLAAKLIKQSLIEVSKIKKMNENGRRGLLSNTVSSTSSDGNNSNNNIGLVSNTVISSSSESSNSNNNSMNNNNNYSSTTSTSTTTTTTTTTNSIAKKKKNLIILVRKNPNWGHRDWSDEEVNSLHNAFTHPSRFLHTHNIIIHSSLAIMQSNFSLSQEIVELYHADILIGIHGAGLTKQMFMPSNSLIMEISGLLNDVQLPVCGYYGNMAYMFGHHHYLYAYDRDNGNNRYINKKGGERGGELMNPEEVAEEAWQYYQFIHSSLILRH